MSSSEQLAPAGALGHKAMITGVVVALHAAGIWALQSGMSRPPEPQIIAAEVIAQFIAPPAPEPPAPAPAAPPTPAPPSHSPNQSPLSPNQPPNLCKKHRFYPKRLQIPPLRPMHRQVRSTVRLLRRWPMQHHPHQQPLLHRQCASPAFRCCCAVAFQQRGLFEQSTPQLPFHQPPHG